MPWSSRTSAFWDFLLHHLLDWIGDNQDSADTDGHQTSQSPQRAAKGPQVHSLPNTLPIWLLASRIFDSSVGFWEHCMLRGWVALWNLGCSNPPWIYGLISDKHSWEIGSIPLLSSQVVEDIDSAERWSFMCIQAALWLSFCRIKGWNHAAFAAWQVTLE